jgi:hypothetical protein
MVNGASLIGALLLGGVYLSCNYIHSLTALFRRRWLSFSSGVSVAYVFVDVLPQLEMQQRAMAPSIVGAALFPEKRIYLFALLGFVVFYGLARLARARETTVPAAAETGAFDARLWLHITGFVLYNLLIGHLLVDRAAAGALALGAYVVAMALHIVVIDQELVADLGGAYGRTFRWGLAASVVAGCSIGTSGWIPAAAFSRFYAFIAGGVVLLSAKAELPEGTGGRFSWFVLGAALTAAVLLVA